MMHLEKNYTENMVYMVWNIAGRTKDNAKSREDLELYCNRPHLHLTANRRRKPKAPYALTLDERRQVLKWLKNEVKFPEGYASNWSRCINLSNATITGLKSHDYHIFMERLLPAAFRDFLPDVVCEPLCEISAFFREICSKELDPVRLEQLEKDIVVTMCKLEKHFPPSFFDSMEHLLVHVAREARLGGPVNCRWMYSSERDFDAHMNEIGRATSPSTLDTLRKNEFAIWLNEKVLADPSCDQSIRSLALMPQRRAMCYEGYDVNGFRFHTKAYSQRRSRDNSGVCVKGECPDDTHYDYYGILEEVVQLEYNGVNNKVVLFKCHWFNPVNGVRVDRQHGLLEVKHNSSLRSDELFVLACQATQVYYLPYASKKGDRKNWWIAMKTKRISNLGVEEADANPDFYQEELPPCPISITDGEDFDWDNMVIQENDFETVHPSELGNRSPQDTTDSVEEDYIYEQLHGEYYDGENYDEEDDVYSPPHSDDDVF